VPAHHDAGSFSRNIFFFIGGKSVIGTAVIFMGLDRAFRMIGGIFETFDG
jgi:hypothetical protein